MYQGVTYLIYYIKYMYVHLASNGVYPGTYVLHTHTKRKIQNSKKNESPDHKILLACLPI